MLSWYEWEARTLLSRQAYLERPAGDSASITKDGQLRYGRECPEEGFKVVGTSATQSSNGEQVQMPSLSKSGLVQHGSAVPPGLSN